MLNRLKKILNTYTDKELEAMDLWINSNNWINAIIVDDNSINLITDDAELKINGVVEKEGDKYVTTEKYVGNGINYQD